MKLIKQVIKKFLPLQLIIIIKDIIDNTKLEKANAEEIARWNKQGKPSPPPHAIKQEVIGEFRKKFNIETLIETGTFHGLMIYAQKTKFKKIVSIEIDKSLYEEALKKFSIYNHIELHCGDSAHVLKKVVRDYDYPCLYWLDGHYSGGVTGKGKYTTPILEELKTIFDSDINHIVLIDDARFFTGEDDYPTIEGLRLLIKKLRPKYIVDNQNDIIRLYSI